MNQIKLHEFLASGGVLSGIDAATKVPTWTEPVDLSTGTVPDECPWHPVAALGGLCQGWELIKLGHRTGNALTNELQELRKKPASELADQAAFAQIAMAQQEPVVVLSQSEYAAATAPRPQYYKPGQRARNAKAQLMDTEKRFMGMTENIPDEITFEEGDGPDEEE